MENKETIQNFDFSDGFIEKINITHNRIEVLFEKWDGKKFHFIFRESFYLCNNMSINVSISHVEVEPLRKGISETLDNILETYEGESLPNLIRFFDSWESECVLEILATFVDVMRLTTCSECEGDYYQSASEMESLCPECSNILYGYKNCIHELENNRCIRCFWDGRTSDYLKNRSKDEK